VNQTSWAPVTVAAELFMAGELAAPPSDNKGPAVVASGGPSERVESRHQDGLPRRLAYFAAIKCKHGGTKQSSC